MGSLFYNNNNYFTPIYKNTKLDKQLYIDCYKDKLDKMYIEYRNSSLEKYSNDFQHLNNTFIIEYTPKGNVIMKYNYDNNSIDYYCDNSISNDIIRTVFQKFTIVNHCFPLYFGHIEKKQKSKLSDDNIQNNSETEDNHNIKKKLVSNILKGKNNNVFAKLKKNTKFDQVLQQKDKEQEQVQNNNKEEKLENKLPGLCTIRNSGRFYNANIFKKYNDDSQNTDSINKTGKKVSFLEFKKKNYL